MSEEERSKSDDEEGEIVNDENEEFEDSTVKTVDHGLFSISEAPSDGQKLDRTIYYNKDISLLEEAKSPNTSRNSSKCWNCGETDHSLRDCKERRNYQSIEINRQLFMSKKVAGSEFKRYHLEIKDLCPNATPGVVSDRLREALGLKKNQLPVHIYNMRKLGYPPGWLEDCTSSKTGINMLDSRGERIPDHDEEEGEIDIPFKKYKLSKIIDYPGYNVWPPPDTINETQKYNALPMSVEHSKVEFIKELKMIMEQNEFAVRDNKSVNVAEDIEIDELESSDVIIEENVADIVRTKTPEVQTTTENKTSNHVEEPKELFSTPTHGRVVSIELGTPSLKTHSPYSNLPPSESFRKDISDVEFFENLPNSTGVYQRLKNVLKSVQSKLASIRDDK